MKKCIALQHNKFPILFNKTLCLSTFLLVTFWGRKTVIQTALIQRDIYNIEHISPSHCMYAHFSIVSDVKSFKEKRTKRAIIPKRSHSTWRFWDVVKKKVCTAQQ